MITIGVPPGKAGDYLNANDYAKWTPGCADKGSWWETAARISLKRRVASMAAGLAPRTETLNKNRFCPTINGAGKSCLRLEKAVL